MRGVGLAAIALLGGLAPGCTGHPPGSPAVAADWVVGRSPPDFDPDGPPDPLRWSLERLLTRSLVEEDTGGRIVPDAAERFGVSRDRLTWTFRLRDDLRYPDGTRCTSRDFRVALAAGLNRTDHATRPWLLSAVRGVDAVRAGRPLPALGIETPDPLTLVIHLVRPDPLLPRKLALPGVSAAWGARAREGGWDGARGLGPYRIARSEPGRLRFVRLAGSGGAPDTLNVRFVPSAPRVRSLLRAGRVDLVWPVPPGLADPPPGYLTLSQPARPARWLWLVMRADLPPTSKLAARHALAHAVHYGELKEVLGGGASADVPWLPGAPPFVFPKLDGGEVSAWLARGKLGRSFHVTLAFDADGPAAAAARLLQGATARSNLYVELRPLRGSRLADEALRGSAHLLLVEMQPPYDRPEAYLAPLVMPLRGPAVGGARTGWRTREFDPWIAPKRSPPPFDALRVAERLEQELVALPVAAVPWGWVVRRGGPAVRLHPRFGPEFAGDRTGGRGRG